jgi:hypothetical protein
MQQESPAASPFSDLVMMMMAPPMVVVASVAIAAAISVAAAVDTPIAVAMVMMTVLHTGSEKRDQRTADDKNLEQFVLLLMQEFDHAEA